jgi:hypothetical protein
MSLSNKRFTSILLFLLSVIATACCQDISNEGSCDRDVCEPKPKPKCRVFDPNNFGPENKTIIYGEAKGRIGNQLLGEKKIFFSFLCNVVR